MQYRRTFSPGGSYFFTLVTKNRRPLFNLPENVAVLRDAFSTVRTKRPFKIDAIVILPDHLHCIWTLPDKDTDYATRWRLIKTWFTKHCDRNLLTPPKTSKGRKQQQAIWQNRYWEHLLRDNTDFEKHIDYIHYNPCKHGLVDKPVDWKYSSFHHFLKHGILTADWTCDSEFNGIGAE